MQNFDKAGALLIIRETISFLLLVNLPEPCQHCTWNHLVSWWRGARCTQFRSPRRRQGRCSAYRKVRDNLFSCQQNSINMPDLEFAPPPPNLVHGWEDQHKGISLALNVGLKLASPADPTHSSSLKLEGWNVLVEGDRKHDSICDLIDCGESQKLE